MLKETLTEERRLFCHIFGATTLVQRKIARSLSLVDIIWSAGDRFSEITHRASNVEQKHIFYPHLQRNTKNKEQLTNMQPHAEDVHPNFNFF